MEQKTIARINSLYSASKIMPWVCVLGIFIPILLIFGSLLGLLYRYQLSKLLILLDQQSSANLPPPLPVKGKTVAEKIEHIRKAKLAFVAPLIVGVFYILAMAVIIVVANK
jgi:hypothetical protein